MFSLIGISIGMALLNVPPVPPPPPDRLAAAAELRRLAPLTAAMKDDALGRAIVPLSFAVFAKVDRPNYPDMPFDAQQRMRDRLAARQPQIDESVGRCLDEWLGHNFELTTLQEMKSAVVTKGGYVLWVTAIWEPVRTCYSQTVTASLFDFTPALAWLAEHGLLTRVPRYDPARSDLPSFVAELETLCGRRAHGVVQTRPTGLGILSKWIDRDIKRSGGATYACLSNAAKAGGYDLFSFER